MNIRDLAKARVVVVGDAMIDRWIWGHYSKIGPEGVPVFLEERTEDREGGAANVLANLEALGCDARIFAKPYEQRPVKTRYATTGSVFRSDREDCSPIDETLVRGFMGFLDAIERPQVLVISDYAKGVCTPSLCQQLIGWAKAKGVKVVVDPKGTDWRKYDGCDVITPNAKEMAEVQYATGPHSLGTVMTCGANGMIVTLNGGEQIHIPATAREVYDVTGAGDTVVAVLAASLAMGFDLETAARMANAAAGVVVGKRGTATCSLEELEAAYNSAGIESFRRSLEPASGFCAICGKPIADIHNPEHECKPKPMGSALPSHHWDGSPRTSQRPYSSMDAVMLGHKKPFIGFTNGCFDLLHEGHRHFLRECQKQCDKLVVAINSDASVRALKGVGRPIVFEGNRWRRVLRFMRPDDEVHLLADEEMLVRLLLASGAKVIFKGEEYRGKFVTGRGIAAVTYIPMLSGFSTTLEIARRA